MRHHLGGGRLRQEDCHNFKVLPWARVELLSQSKPPKIVFKDFMCMSVCLHTWAYITLHSVILRVLEVEGQDSLMF